MGVIKRCPKCESHYLCGAGFDGREEWPEDMAECYLCGETLVPTGLWD